MTLSLTPTDQTARTRSLLAITASMGVVLAASGDEAIDAKTVRERVKDTAGVTMPAVQAGTVVRAMRTSGILERSGSAFVKTPKAAAAVRRMDDSDRLVQRLIRRHLDETAVFFGVSDAGQLRHQFYRALETVAAECFESADVGLDEDRRIVPTDVALASLDRRAVIEDAGCPSRFVAAVAFLLGSLIDDRDPILRWALAEATVSIVCQGWFRRLSQERRDEILAQTGPPHILIETSHIVDMALTPDRFDEGMLCVRDARSAGIRLEILDVSVDEFMAGLDAAEERLEQCLKQIGIYGTGGRSLRWAVSEEEWFCRAAAEHGLFGEYAAAASDRTRHLLVNDFVAELRLIPERLRQEGVQVGTKPRHKSQEQHDRFRRALEKMKDRPGGLAHDAAVLAHVDVVRVEKPFSFVASTDKHFSPAYRSAVALDDHGRFDIALPPLALSQLVSSLHPVSSREGSRSAIREMWRFGLWALDETFDSIESAEGTQPVLIADNGEPEAGDRHPRCEAVHRVLDGAMERREREALDLVTVSNELKIIEPDSEVDDVREGEPVTGTGSNGPQKWVADVVLSVLAAFVLVLGLSASARSFVSSAVAPLLDLEKLQSQLAGGLGLLVVAVESIRLRRDEISLLYWAAALALTVLAVLGAGLVG